jgi:hypothetical protein
MMDELVAWLREQLDDDERVARACVDAAGPERQGEPFTDGSGTAERDAFPSYPWGNLDAELTFMQGPGHPARVLAEVDAKRRIVTMIVDRKTWRSVPPPTFIDLDIESQVLELLALPYADRPGYREEWR